MGVAPPGARRRPLLALLLASAAVAALPGDLRAEDVLLSGATVHTVSGEPLAPGQVLLRDGKIAGVGKTVDAPGAAVVDLAGLHLYPGLLAATTSLGLAEIGAVRATQDTSEVGAYSPEVQAWIAVNPDSELLPVARANGVTHALTLPMGGIVTGQSGLISLVGWTPEDMTIRSPVAMHLFWPSMDLDLTPKELWKRKDEWKPPEKQAEERRAKLKELDDFFEEAKAYQKAREASAAGATPAPGAGAAPGPGASAAPAAGAGGGPVADAGGEAGAPPKPAVPAAAPAAAPAAGKMGIPQDRAIPAWEAMLPVLRGELQVMIHADEVRQIKAALAWAETRGLKVILAGGRDAWMVADLLAAKKVPLVYEATFEQPARDWEDYDVHFKAPAALAKAGVLFAFSPGIGAWHAAEVRNLPYHAAQAMAFGLPADEAVKALTLYPARILGVADRLGSIEVGKEASLIAVTGDVLDIRSNVRRMWIAGREASLSSRHTRLFEKYDGRPRPK
ncbi:MAG: amidohydrolase family protein [Planctomycetes bacterium]|nr:amidohydrolase family protein [Planctomycetota bacterium]